MKACSIVCVPSLSAEAFQRLTFFSFLVQLAILKYVLLVKHVTNYYDNFQACMEALSIVNILMIKNRFKYYGPFPRCIIKAVVEYLIANIAL